MGGVDARGTNAGWPQGVSGGRKTATAWRAARTRRRDWIVATMDEGDDDTDRFGQHRNQIINKRVLNPSGRDRVPVLI